MWMPPDLGKQYVRELERKQREEAYLREDRTGRPSRLLGHYRLGIGQKLLLLAGVVVTLFIFLLILSSLSTPAAG